MISLSDSNHEVADLMPDTYTLDLKKLMYSGTRYTNPHEDNLVATRNDEHKVPVEEMASCVYRWLIHM